MFEIHNDDGAKCSAVILAFLSGGAVLCAWTSGESGWIRVSTIPWSVAILSAVMCVRSIYYWLVALPLRELRVRHTLLDSEVERATDRFDEYMRCNNTEIHDIKEDIQYLKKDVCKALVGSKPKNENGNGDE